MVCANMVVITDGILRINGVDRLDTLEKGSWLRVGCRQIKVCLCSANVARIAPGSTPGEGYKRMLKIRRISTPRGFLIWYNMMVRRFSQGRICCDCTHLLGLDICALLHHIGRVIA